RRAPPRAGGLSFPFVAFPFISLISSHDPGGGGRLADVSVHESDAVGSRDLGGLGHLPRVGHDVEAPFDERFYDPRADALRGSGYDGRLPCAVHGWLPRTWIMEPVRWARSPRPARCGIGPCPLPVPHFSWAEKVVTKIDKLAVAALIFGCPGHARRTDHRHHPALPGRAARRHGRRADGSRAAGTGSRRATPRRRRTGLITPSRRGRWARCADGSTRPWRPARPATGRRWARPSMSSSRADSSWDRTQGRKSAR